MAQTLNIKGFIAGIDIELDEFMLPLNEVIVNSIQAIEDKTHNEQDKKLDSQIEGYFIFRNTLILEGLRCPCIIPRITISLGFIL